MSNREQVSVPLPAELRAYVQRVAEREVTSQAAVIRRLVAEAARKARSQEQAA
jgi:metal-responsive CopG/Arc/MetJ family transcriptional regulator